MLNRLACFFCFLLIAGAAHASDLVVQTSNAHYCGGAGNSSIKYAIIDAATSGNNTIVAAVPGKKIRVLSYTLIATGAVLARWESAANGTALSGQMSLTTSVGIAPDCGSNGCFETVAGQLLNLELSAATSVDGHVTYVECQ